MTTFLTVLVSFLQKKRLSIIAPLDNETSSDFFTNSSSCIPTSPLTPFSSTGYHSTSPLCNLSSSLGSMSLTGNGLQQSSTESQPSSKSQSPANSASSTMVESMKHDRCGTPIFSSDSAVLDREKPKVSF